MDGEGFELAVLNLRLFDLDALVLDSDRVGRSSAFVCAL